MYIGTLRVEEARTFSNRAGMHTLQNGVRVEIFWHDGGHMDEAGYPMEQAEDDDMPLDEWHDKSRHGWYFRVDGDPKDTKAEGPFGFSGRALEHACIVKGTKKKKN